MQELFERNSSSYTIRRPNDLKIPRVKHHMVQEALNLRGLNSGTTFQRTQNLQKTKHL